GFYPHLTAMPLDYLQAGIAVLLRMRAPRKPDEMKDVFSAMYSFSSPYVCQLKEGGNVEQIPGSCMGPIWSNYTSRIAQASTAVPFFALIPASQQSVASTLLNIIEKYGNHAEYLKHVLFAKGSPEGINLFSPLHWSVLLPPSREPADIMVHGS